MVEANPSPQQRGGGSNDNSQSNSSADANNSSNAARAGSQSSNTNNRTSSLRNVDNHDHLGVESDTEMKAQFVNRKLNFVFSQ